tara:strand:+ start:1666 stop:2034 length:369 start_codon:yes stop_codon:yes gene_type:complete
MKAANAQQKQWMDDITTWADNGGLEFLYDEYTTKPFQRHHVLGRAAKHNKVAIGHWFILPVPFELHDVMSNHKYNVTHHKKKFVAKFGFQSHLFATMVYDMEQEEYEVPPLDVRQAIAATNS